MLISFNYDTATTTANKSMGFDLSAIQSCNIIESLFKKVQENKMGPVSSEIIWIAFHAIQVLKLTLHSEQNFLFSKAFLSSIVVFFIKL